jgi:hypothetical protein
MRWKPKRTIFDLLGVVFVALALLIPDAGGTASAAQISAMSWDESNITVLRSANVADVAKFVNGVECGDKSPCGINIEEFAWADLESNGKYALVDVWDNGNRAEAVSIYQRNSSGQINDQSIDVEGYAYEKLTNAIRDLNGDGKKELIINRGFGEGPGGMAGIPLAEIPLVYRLQDGQYVEASREFPGFYDKEVLPPLEQEVATLRKKLDSEAEARTSGEALLKEYHRAAASTVGVDSRWSPEQAAALQDTVQLATLQLLRFKVLRVSGRDPTAEEEKQAREWMKGPAIELVDDAEEAYVDMGGHEADLQAAKLAAKRLIADAKRAPAH